MTLIVSVHSPAFAPHPRGYGRVPLCETRSEWKEAAYVSWRSFTLKLEEEKGFPSSNKNYALLKSLGAYSIYKARIPCVSLRGNKLRIVYVRHQQAIEFIVLEIYPKNEKNREDTDRITEYMENHGYKRNWKTC